MREEITEPKHWRAGVDSGSSRNNSWTTRRRTQEEAQLAADAVDAALADDAATVVVDQKPEPADIVASLATQLELLEQQREQIQHMLEQVQGK